MPTIISNFRNRSSNTSSSNTITTNLRNRSSSSNDSSRNDSFASNLSGRAQASSQYISALQGQFDKVTTQELDRYRIQQEDLDISNNQFQEDISRIRSRSNTDYYTGVALQNSEFSKTLDVIANATKQRVGTFDGLGKRSIETATGTKQENDARLQLNFDRGNEDLDRDEDRTQARYELNSERLNDSKKQFEEQRAIDRNVLGIQAQSNYTQYQDNLRTSSTLTQNAATQRSQPIFGGGTGIQNIFSYFK